MLDPVAVLGATLEIRTLKTRYFRYIDLNLWRSLRGLFTDDAVLRMPEIWSEPKSADEAVTSFAAALSVRDSVHTGYDPDIAVTSDSTAHGTWVMDDRLYRAGTAQALGDHRLIHGFGVYEETYRREAAGWKIESLLLVRSRVDGFAALDPAETASRRQRIQSAVSESGSIETNSGSRNGPAPSVS
ncbi:hypothetical protein BH09ACT6_BH09ACT6_23490 [soil metagenome]